MKLQNVFIYLSQEGLLDLTETASDPPVEFCRSVQLDLSVPAFAAVNPDKPSSPGCNTYILF